MVGVQIRIKDCALSSKPKIVQAMIFKQVPLIPNAINQTVVYIFSFALKSGILSGSQNSFSNKIPKFLYPG